MGGAVKGGDLYGRFPTLAAKNANNNNFDGSADQLGNGALLLFALSRRVSLFLILQTLLIGTLYAYREADSDKVPQPAPFADRMLDRYRVIRGY